MRRFDNSKSDEVLETLMEVQDTNVIEDHQTQVSHEWTHGDQVMTEGQDVIQNELEYYNPGESFGEQIGRAPNWLLRSGIMMVGLVMLLLISLSYWISYPDKISTTGVLTTDTPSLGLIAHDNRQIDRIIVEDGTIVSEGDFLIYLNNTAELRDIISLKKWLSEIELGMPHSAPPAELDLGAVQTIYADLVSTFNQYAEVRQDDVTMSQLNTIQREMDNISRLNHSMDLEQVFFISEGANLIKDYERSKVLKSDGLISEKEYEKIESRYFQFQRAGEEMNRRKIQNEIRKDQLTLSGKELTAARTGRLQVYKFEIIDILTRLEGLLREWEDDNYVKAGVSGVLNYHSDISDKVVLRAGQMIGYIVPEQMNQRKYVVADVSSDGLAKLENGSKVIIRLDAYPDEEFGILEGKVDQFSLVPYSQIDGASKYQVKVLLPKELKTNYGLEIPYRPNMSASIDMITEDRSILDRVFDQFLDLLSN